MLNQSIHRSLPPLDVRRKNDAYTHSCQSNHDFRCFRLLQSELNQYCILWYSEYLPLHQPGRNPPLYCAEYESQQNSRCILLHRYKFYKQLPLPWHFHLQKSLLRLCSRYSQEYHRAGLKRLHPQRIRFRSWKDRGRLQWCWKPQPQV